MPVMVCAQKTVDCFCGVSSKVDVPYVPPFAKNEGYDFVCVCGRQFTFLDGLLQFSVDGGRH